MQDSFCNLQNTWQFRRRPKRIYTKKHKLPDRTSNILVPHKVTYFSPCQASWKRVANATLKGLRPNKRSAGIGENWNGFSWALNHSAWRSNSPPLQEWNVDKLIICVSRPTNIANVCNKILVISPLMIRLSSGRAMNETDFWSDRFEGLPSFFRTLDFRGRLTGTVSSSTLSFSSPLVTEDWTAPETTEEESAMTLENKAEIHASFSAARESLFWSMFCTPGWPRFTRRRLGTNATCGRKNRTGTHKVPRVFSLFWIYLLKSFVAGW